MSAWRQQTACSVTWTNPHGNDLATTPAVIWPTRFSVRSAGRRSPMAIAHRTLPAIPAGMSVSDLELEVRTINCLVRAGIHKRPQDLPAMTVESILGLRGFWVKCLVDLLTSLEHAIDHPRARKFSREGDERMAVPAPTSGRYPRFGQRLAPSLLGIVLAVPIPNRLRWERPPRACSCATWMRPFGSGSARS